MTISIFGGTGFIGGNYHNIYPNSVVIPRHQITPIKDTDTLYFISTIDNYNVFTNPTLDIETNLIHLVRVLEKFKDTTPGSTFNFISSWFVYGNTELPAKETSPCNPMGFYSITKYAAERMVESYCKTFDLKYRILRLGNVYGLRATKVSKQRNAMQYLVGKVIKGEPIDLYNKGSDIRDFIHVSDACNAIKLCMDKGNLNSIYNIGSGIPQNFIDIMLYVKEQTKSSSQINFIDPPKFHKIVQVKDMYLDITKLKELGFNQKIPLFTGLDQIIAYEYHN